MYPPAISYEVYKIERGLTLTGADQRAADKRAGEMAAALGHQWRALVRLFNPGRGTRRVAPVEHPQARCGQAHPVAPGAPGAPRRRQRPSLSGWDRGPSGAAI